MIRKKVKSIKLFQRSLFPKRFFIIDFSAAEIMIKKTKEEKNQKYIIQIPFRNILSLEDMDYDSWGPDDAKYCFKVMTTERPYWLYFTTE